MTEDFKINGKAKKEPLNGTHRSNDKSIPDNHAAHTSRRTLKSEGFILAAQLGATIQGLRTAMQNVYSNYVAASSEKSIREKKEVEKKMESIREEVVKIDNQKEKIKEVEIPEVQKEMEAIKVEIEDTRINATTDHINSNYNLVKHILYSVASVTLALALIFFYTSLIYNALFKDFNEVLLSSDAADSANLFNTLIDVKALFKFNTGVLLSYLFSTLFITLGLLLHSDMISKGKMKWLKLSLLLLFALGAELGFAYKIEQNIQEMKSLVLIDFHPAEHWWQLLLSIDVLLVIILGFLAYIVWSAIFEQSIKEKNKRDPRKVAAVKIREMEKKIGRLKYKVGELNGKVAELSGQKKVLEEMLINLEKKLNHAFFDQQELEVRLDQFFKGWLHYLNVIDEYKRLVPDHQKEFLTLKEQLVNNNETIH